MSHPASRLCHTRDAAQPPEGSVMKELFHPQGMVVHAGVCFGVHS
jgi:hypothetical protein